MDEKTKHLAILGSTGSIGTQTLDVVSRYPDRFKADVLTANSNVDLLASQAIEFGARDVVICDISRYAQLSEKLSGTGINVHAGMDAICSLVVEENIDIVVGAMVGFSGLRSVVAALEAGKVIALANKETLVAAGSVVDALVKGGHGIILPVDSEHSAIFQCLQGSHGDKVSKIHLTASGGPFRTWEKENIAVAKASDALKHPNWNMGAKVTIDSATMMNKGLEVIEAKWLFGVDPGQINVVVHPQSIVHSMVEYEDGAVIAQLGSPDMREPIQYALSYPNRIALNNRKLDFAAIGSLEFQKPDTDKFPCLGIAFEAIRRGGTVPAAMNAANEVAVKAYLDGRIDFYGIAELITKTMNALDVVDNPSLDDIFAVNDEAQSIARSLLK